MTEYDAGKSASEHVQRRYSDVRIALGLLDSMSRAGEGPSKKSIEAVTAAYKSLNELRRLADSSWPRQLHDQYLALLDERDALQEKLDRRRWFSRWR